MWTRVEQTCESHDMTHVTLRTVIDPDKRYDFVQQMTSEKQLISCVTATLVGCNQDNVKISKGIHDELLSPWNAVRRQARNDFAGTVILAHVLELGSHVSAAACRGCTYHWLVEKRGMPVLPDKLSQRQKVRGAIAAQFWEQPISSSRSIDGIARTLPCEPPPLPQTAPSGLSRSQQLLAAQALHIFALPAFDGNHGGLVSRLFVQYIPSIR